MNTLWFWNGWRSAYKYLYLSLLLLFGVSIVFIGIAYFWDYSFSGSINIETEYNPIKLTLDHFNEGIFNFDIPKDGYIAEDVYVTELPSVAPYMHWIYLVFLFAGLTILLVTMSFMEMYWYIASLLCLLFFWYTTKLELLNFMGMQNRVPFLLVFLIYSITTYLFNYQFKNAGYLLRIGVFGSINFIVITGLCVGSGIDNVAEYITNHSTLFPITLTVLFCIVIGHDIIKGFLYIVTNSSGDRTNKTVFNFMLVCSLYLINVMLLLLKEMYVINWEIVYINPILLYIISSILGIWMFRKRSEMFSNILPFNPAGAYVYLSIAIISNIGIAYAYINGNTAHIKSYNFIIIYTHLIFGFMFALYVFINFGNFFASKMNIYASVYDPKRIGFLTTSVLSVFGCIAFLMYQNNYPYKLILSGYYTNAGDLYAKEKNYSLALEYYKEAIGYDFPNTRANYSVGNIYLIQNNPEEAEKYFESAIARESNYQAYIGLGNANLAAGKSFDALTTLQEAIRKYPNETSLYNNIGIVYNKTKDKDSTLYYFFNALDRAPKNEQVASNLIGFLTSNNHFEDADSIGNLYSSSEYLPLQTNRMALENISGKKTKQTFPSHYFKDSSLNVVRYAYLVNYGIQHKNDDKNYLSTLNKLALYPENTGFSESLQEMKAIENYYSGNVSDGIIELSVMRNASNEPSRYANILAYWYVQQKLYPMAADQFDDVLRSNDQSVHINYCITAIKAGLKQDAVPILMQLTNSSDSNTVKMADRLLALSQLKLNASIDEKDIIPLLYLRGEEMTYSLLEGLLAKNQNPNIKAFILAEMLFKKVNSSYCINQLLEPGEINENTKQYIQTMLQWYANNTSDIELLKKSEFTPGKYAPFISTLNNTNLSKDALIQLIKKYPFDYTIVHYAQMQLNKKGFSNEAYNVIVDIFQEIPIYGTGKAYLEQCIEMNLVSYAETTLKAMESILSKEEFANYSKQVNTMLAQ